MVSHTQKRGHHPNQAPCDHQDKNKMSLPFLPTEATSPSNGIHGTEQQSRHAQRALDSTPTLATARKFGHKGSQNKKTK